MGGFRFLHPNGREVAVAGGARALPAEPVEPLRAQHRADGIAIDAWTGFPRSDGQPPDYAHAVFCLVGQDGRSNP